jgi:hypothetical protein
MNVKIALFLTVAVALMTGCGGSRTDKFPMEKPFWSPDDYYNAIMEIEFQTPQGEKYPTLTDPETAPIFNKLINRENISVVVDDTTLGIRHRAEFASKMFDEYRKMVNLYHVMDREDKFVYASELVEILRFGLYLEIPYFKLGNDEILQEADDSTQVKSNIKSNEKTIVSNFNLYLDFINKEQSFSSESLQLFATGIDEEFTKLMQTFPDANYAGMLTKATAMQKKATNPSVKSSLENLITKLKAKTGLPETDETSIH